LIGSGPMMQTACKQLGRVAPQDVYVLILGESGTGKELIARAIHYNSPRTGGPFVAVNLAAVPETLIESELFGHKKGAFTDARTDKPGLFTESDGGTIFLDEIGELALGLQAKLLRVLQDYEIRPVGATKNQRVDVRVIAATNKDLEAMLADGSFREDLYYRLNVIHLDLPPLRQRREDIPLLVDFFLQKCCKQMDLPPKQISVEAMQMLESYDWPGNVRELENLIERALALSHSETITTRDLPVHLLTHRRMDSSLIELPEEGLDLEAYLEGIRAQLMQQALERTDGVQTQAAELLGMSFRSFRYYAKKAGLKGGD